MSAVLPRSKSGGAKGPKLAASSKETCKKKKTQMGGAALQHQFSGKSTDELVKGDHPWSGVGERVLQILPPDWRTNIQQAFSSMGEALGKLMGGGQEGGRRMGGRRGF